MRKKILIYFLIKYINITKLTEKYEVIFALDPSNDNSENIIIND